MADILTWLTWGAIVGVIGFVISIITFFWKARDRWDDWKKRPQLEINC